MKKLIILTFIALGVCGCEDKNVDIKSTDIVVSGRHLKTYTIDGCEYIGKVWGTNNDIITHKGNCSNPIHIYSDGNK